MILKKIFLWIAEGTVVIGILCAANAQLALSVYYYLVRFLDKVKAVIIH